VIGKFSIRIVPDQTPQEVQQLTKDFLTRKWSERKTPNKLKMWSDGDRGWVTDTNNMNFTAGIRLVISVTATIIGYKLIIDVLLVLNLSLTLFIVLLSYLPNNQPK